jgi:hypothetical protein
MIKVVISLLGVHEVVAPGALTAPAVEAASHSV